jgi:hypothetical protein
MLADAGYDCVGVSANGWVSPRFGFGQGFRELFLHESEHPHATDLDRDVVARIPRLRSPFFLYVHYVDPHLPYEPRTDWRGQPADRPPMSVEEANATHEVNRPPELLRRANDLYDGEIRGADQGLEELVKALRRRGELGRTLLVVTSDHGEEHAEHGRMSHGQTGYGEVLRVPLLLVGPGVPKGKRLGEASLLDVVPTLGEMLDLDDRRDTLDGRSLVPALRGRRQAPRTLLAHLDFVDGAALALQQGRYKLVLAKRPYAKQVFDLDADPGERHDLSATPIGRRMLRTLGERSAALYDSYARRALPQVTAQTDAALLRSFAALGYAGPAAAKASMRRIPRRIGPPDELPFGSLGWDEAPASCLRVGDQVVPELLAGWYAAEAQGRWSAQHATLRLGRSSADPASLELGGVNYRPTAADLVVRIDGRAVLRSTVPVGRFRLVASVPAGSAVQPVLVDLATADAFQPSRSAGGDQRLLGLFYDSICLR